MEFLYLVGQMDHIMHTHTHTHVICHTILHLLCRRFVTCLPTRALFAGVYECTNNRTITGFADVLLSSGRYYDLDYDRYGCEQECNAQPACASFVWRADDGYCELWSRSTGYSSRSGRMHCAKGILARAYVCVCVCVCVRARACVCVCVCACVALQLYPRCEHPRFTQVWRYRSDVAAKIIPNTS